MVGDPFVLGGKKAKWGEKKKMDSKGVPGVSNNRSFHSEKATEEVGESLQIRTPLLGKQKQKNQNEEMEKGGKENCVQGINNQSVDTARQLY